MHKKFLFLINFHLDFYFLHCSCFLMKSFSMKMVTLSSTTYTFSFLLQLFIFMPILWVSFSKEHPTTSPHVSPHTSPTYTSTSIKTTKTPITTSTTPSGLPLNSPCSNASVCGRNTFCRETTSLADNPSSGVCRCLLGYLPSPANHIDCTAFNCTSGPIGNSGGSSGGDIADDLLCHSTFNSNFTKCSTSNSLCICDTSFTLNTSSQHCLPAKVPLGGGSCQGLDRKCGQNAVCNGNDQCQCRLGALPVAWNRLNCDLYHCSEDQDCRGPFGALTLCVAGACYCNQQVSTLDHDTQRCIVSGQKVGGNCTRDRECATNADCVEGACRCQFGYVPAAGGRDCGVFHCNNTQQCVKLVDAHSSCSGRGSSSGRDLCQCTEGYEVNPEMQSCVPSSAQRRASDGVPFKRITLWSFLSICLLLNYLTTTR